MTGDARRSILVVEDDPDLLALVEMLLAGEGHRVRTAPEGRAALARVEEELPGLILLDMRMPGMNGWEFARELRARYGSPCPIVVVTAAEDARRSAETIGADAFVAKPFDIDELLAVVARFVGPESAAGGRATPPRGAEPSRGDHGS